MIVAKGILTPKYVLVVNVLIITLVIIYAWFMKSVPDIIIAAAIGGSQIGVIALRLDSSFLILV